jgi:hypothetical protein
MVNFLRAFVTRAIFRQKLSRTWFPASLSFVYAPGLNQIAALVEFNFYCALRAFSRPNGFMITAYQIVNCAGSFADA